MLRFTDKRSHKSFLKSCGLLFNLLLVGLMLSHSSQAQTPANNDCVNAQAVIIPNSGNICINSSSLTATSANTTNVCTDPTPINEVWFTYVAAGPVNQIIVTPSGGSPIQQAVVTYSDAACGSGTYDDCDAANTSGGAAFINFSSAAGALINISVGGLVADGDFELCITSQPAPPDPGNTCPTATTICDHSSFTVNTANFTPSGISPDCFDVQDQFGNIFPAEVENDMWFEFTVGQTGTLEFTGTVFGPQAEFDWALFDITNGCSALVWPNQTATVSCNYYYSTALANPPYTVDFGMGLPAGGEFNAPVTVTAGNTYAIMVENFQGVAANIEFEWGGTFQMAPTSSFTINNPSGCNSVTTGFTNNSIAAVSYNWDFGNGNTSNLQNPPAQTYGSPGTYFVTLTTTSSTGCTDLFVQAIEVFPEPTLSFTATDETCDGDCDGELTVSASGVGPFTYSWVGGGATNTNSSLCPNNYDVTVTDQNTGCSGTGTGTVSVGASPEDASINPPAATTFCENDPAVALTATNQGSWSGPGVIAGGQFDPATAGVGVHWITHTSSGVCPGTDQVQMTVNSGGGPSINAPANSTFCISDAPTTLTADLPGGNWIGPGMDAGGNFDPALAGPGSHVITYDIPPPCGGSDTWNVTVNEVTFDHSFVHVGCSGELNGEISFNNVNGGSAPYNYSVDGGINFTTVSDFTGLGATNYTLVVEDANGCSSLSVNETISEPDAIVLQIDIINSQCGQPNGQALVTATGGVIILDYQYQWDDPAMQTSALANNLAPNDANNPTYDVLVTDDNGCSATTTAVIGSIGGFASEIADSTDQSCFGICDGGAQVELSGSVIGTPTYQWTASDGTVVGNDFVVSGLCADSYTVLITDQDGCLGTNYVTIEEPPLLTVGISGPTSLCSGGQDQLTAAASGGTGLYSYTWTADPGNTQFVNSGQSVQTIPGNVATDYSVEVMDQAGCIATTLHAVTILPPLSINVSPVDMICPHESTVITFAGSGGNGFYTFGWSINSDTITSPVTSPTTATDLTLEIYLEDGCTQPGASETVVIPVFPNPDADVYPGSVDGCVPFHVTFTDSTIPEPLAYHWDFGDPASTTNSSTLQTDTHTFNQSGVYQALLNYTSIDGCTYAETMNITVLPRPVADFIRTPLEPSEVEFLDPKVVYEDLSVDAESFWIHFGDGDSSNISPVEHIYQDSGLFIPYLVAQNEFGCKDTAYGELHVQPHYTFFVPNAFTPNHDGINEVFKVEAYGLAEMRLEIFDRWGNLLTVFDDIEDEWDGKYKGTLLPNGVYTWNAITRDAKGVNHKYQGIVFLIGGN